jgi:hypothetical protein
MTHHDRVSEILSYYPSESPAVKASLARLLQQGRLAGASPGS